MSNGDHFIDYYNILRVNPNCNAKALANSYHILAKKYHPDHSDEADVAKLTEVIDAYKILKDTEKRADYDFLYSKTTGFVFSSTPDDLIDEKSALSDAEAHEKILLFLYKRRREHADDAGVVRYFVHELLKCSDEIFEFHIWYLKEKGYILTTEQGTLAITIDGVDHVISMSRTTLKEKLLLSQSSEDKNQENF